MKWPWTKDPPALPAGPKEEDEDAPAPQAALVAAQTKQSVDALKEVRDRTGVTAKAIGGIATAAIGTVTVTQVAEVFPLADGSSGWWVVAMLAGVVLVLGAVGSVVARLWGVNTPVMLVSDLAVSKEQAPLSPKECELVKTVFVAMAELNGKDTLRAYEQEAIDELRSSEGELDLTKRAALEAKATHKQAEVAMVLARASLLVVRRRASQAVRGGKTVAAGVAFIAGLLLFVGAQGYLEGEGSGRVARAKACGEAVKAIGDAKAKPAGRRLLDEACDVVLTTPAVTPPPAATTAAAAPAAP